LGFVATLAPEPRHAIKLAIKGLEKSTANTRPLEEDLQGYSRLRIRGYRVVFRYVNSSTIRCVFAERRAVVYELLETHLEQNLLRDDSDL
jgi:mRNA-degrading endonuclease RelE of RelBE toxin-antitoxin system